MLKDEYEVKGGVKMAASFGRDILNPHARWEKMHSGCCDFGNVLAPWEKDVVQYRIAVRADLEQAVKVATVMEHAPATCRAPLKVVHSTNRETHQALRAYVLEWTLAQRSYDDLGRPGPCDIGQVNGVNGKG